MADRLAIADQVAQYTHAFDSRDIDAWVRVFADDGVFDVKLENVSEPVFRAECAEQLCSFARSAPPMLHHISSLVFDELGADSARTRALVLGTWLSPDYGNPAIYTHETYEQRWSKIAGDLVACTPALCEPRLPRQCTQESSGSWRIATPQE